ncbi:MAG: ATP-binding protein [Actinomycetota bacterium]
MAFFSRGPRVAPLPEAAEKRLAALDATLRVSEIGASARPSSEAIQAMVRIAVDLLGAAEGSIMLVEDGGTHLAIVAACGLPRDVPVGSRLAVGESVAGRVLLTGKPLRLGDVDSGAFVNFVPKARHIRSSVVVPLMVAGHAIGVLSLATTGEHTFTDDDLRLAQMFAEQAAALIYRARLHEQAEARSSDLMSLLEAGRGLLGRLDLDALLNEILEGGVRLAGSQAGFACLFDPESGTVARGVFRGLDKTEISAFLEHETVVRAIDRATVEPLKADKRSWVAAGVRTPRGTKGVLMVAVDDSAPVDRTDLLKTYVPQCSTALGSAELHSDVQRKESELAASMMGVANPIVLIDGRRRIVALNPATEQLFGISSVFAVGTNIDGGLGSPEVERLLLGEGDIQAEVTIGNPARAYKVRVNEVQVPGAQRGRVLVMDDITSEREFVQTQSDFVSMIGHELRTPLTIIKGFAKTLMRKADGTISEEALATLGIIDGKAKHLEHLIDDLLYVSRIESREASLRIENVDVGTLLRTVGKEVVDNYPHRDVTIETDGRLEWACDETKVALVVRHLLDNALKYSEAPEPVTVRATCEEDALRIDVIDHGVGIVSSDVPHIFDRFRQLDATSTREHGGTGVGLYLCAQLVRVHGGRIWVDSTWGKGSTFSFSLQKRTVPPEVTKLSSTKDLLKGLEQATG